MRILRYPIILILFMMWKETLNEEINSKNDLNDPRFYENDFVKLNVKTDEIEHERQKKHIAELFKTNLDSNALNKGKGYFLVMKKQPYYLYTPKYNFKNQPINVGQRILETQPQSTQIEENNVKITETEEINANEVISDDTLVLKEKEEIIIPDTEKKLTIVKELPILENPVKEFISETKKPDIVKKKTNGKAHHHQNCPKCKKRKNDTEKSRKNSDNSLSLDKLVDTTNPQSRDGVTKSAKENVNIVENNKLENKIEGNEDQVVLELKNEAIPKRHPFLDVIQNDRYIFSNSDMTPIIKEDLRTNADLRDKNEFKYQEKEMDLSLANEVKSLKENDENEETINNNNNLEEVIEVSKATPRSFEEETQNKAPLNFENYIQTPYYQSPNQYNPGNGALRFAQKETVPTRKNIFFGYSNYFKTPTPYDPYKNNNAYYKKHGYPYSNKYNYGYPCLNQVDWRRINDLINYSIKDGIFKFWKSIEYYMNNTGKVRV